MMKEVKRTKAKKYEWVNKTGELFTVHLDKSVTGLRILVYKYEDGETVIKLCKGNGTTGTFKEFSKESLNDATNEQIENVISQMIKGA